MQSLNDEVEARPAERDAGGGRIPAVDKLRSKRRRADAARERR